MTGVQSRVVSSLFVVCLFQAGGRTEHRPAPHPYHIIADRNAFGLRPAVPAAAVVPAALDQPPAELKLTGIAVLNSKKWTYLVIEERGGAPRYLSLAEGNNEGELEVLEINPAAETVKIRQSGVERVLAFASDRFQTPVERRIEEQKFVAAHVRAHEIRQRQEREREERERAAPAVNR